MKVAKLIEKLRDLPPDSEVAMLWDGALRGDADHVYLSRSGDVVIAPGGQVVYSVADRPEGAPGREEQHWSLPYVDENGNPTDEEIS